MDESKRTWCGCSCEFNAPYQADDLQSWLDFEQYDYQRIASAVAEFGLHPNILHRPTINVISRTPSLESISADVLEAVFSMSGLTWYDVKSRIIHVFPRSRTQSQERTFEDIIYDMVAHAAPDWPNVLVLGVTLHVLLSLRPSTPCFSAEHAKKIIKDDIAQLRLQRISNARILTIAQWNRIDRTYYWNVYAWSWSYVAYLKHAGIDLNESHQHRTIDNEFSAYCLKHYAATSIEP